MRQVIHQACSVWEAVVSEEREPGLSGKQIDALVDEGFLRRIYALSGGTS